MVRLKAFLAAGVAVAIAAPGAAAPKRITADGEESRVPAPAVMQAPATVITISSGRGQLVNLAAPMSDLFVADDNIADVQVRSPTQLYVFGKKIGETTIYATTRTGQVVYSTNVRVASNSASVDQMLRLALPDAAVETTPLNGAILLTGTVATPEEAADAEKLVQAYVGDQTKVISRLRMATPLQVNLQVRIAEVSRDLVKEIGVNLLTRDQTGGFQFGIAQGRSFGSITNFPTANLPNLDASALFGLPAGSLSLPFNPATGQFINPNSGTAFNFNNLGLGSGKTALSLAGKLFGIDIASAIDLAESEGMVTTLANPNLTALSGETASFLAGGEIPIPLAQGFGQIGIEYKQYGVSLAFTPTVLADGRISMRVRPEVSELTTQGSVTIAGFQIPALTTRRAETTVELGSGQSFMIGGLLQNKHFNLIDKAPGLGDVPILGSLFRSSRFRRAETELVIIITPYLVKPSSAPLPLPTDGYKAATDADRVLLGKSFAGQSGAQRPVPTLAPPQTAPAPAAASPVGAQTSQRAVAGTPAPGFSMK